ncbi:MAG: hypothetical protein A2X04_11205 [Bacteroidetes bacterium GWF2_41_9]|nr:MAG: hypothetical protein A2X06_17430 [Bacteroidetes bacterium GWC2_40_22]OFY56928.1 MAG: hypothetical protein A2X04_11205 [Bacteroidetes bacterium GWF2_41_9]HAM09511.1 hypothetical protein [Bacteroidales bacterium]HBQ83950.1 hypothetical protein [Bacteroidales bacterium]
MNRLWLPFIFLLFMFKMHGQSANSPEDIIKEKFRRYCESVPREEIYIHTDRDKYMAGEDLWFSVYLFDRQKNKLSDHSSLAYLELVNSDNHQVIVKRIRLNDGVGPDHILLPDTLSTGRYVIRAYTNWMKNFLPYNCFVREITIYNALSERILTGRPEPYGIRDENVNNSNTLLKYNSGVEMKINKSEDGITELTLETDVSFRASSDNICYLLVQTHGVVNLVKKIDLKSDRVITHLMADVFIPGINQLVIFNDNLEPVLEKLFYTPLNETGYPKLSSADTFKTRDRVSLTIGTDNAESVPSQCFSISVVPATGRISMPDIADYIIFGTEFGPLPEAIRNRNIKDIPVDTLNRFLLKAKSNWIDWHSVISGKFPLLDYPAEQDFHLVKGKLTEKATRVPVRGKNVFLSIPGKTATFQYSRTDSTGSFRFTLPVSNELMDMIIQPEDPDIKSSIIIESPFAAGYFQNSGNADTSSLTLPGFISKWGVNYQISKIYGTNKFVDTNNQTLKSNPPKRFYGKPDIELTMNDYILLPLMEEVFFELTPGVQLKRKRNTYSMTVADPASNRIYEKPPVLFSDGVVINDPAVIAAIDPETVEKIDVIKDLYLVGDYIFFGIVNIITVAGDFSGIELPENAVRRKYRVIDPVVSFTSPDYSSELEKKARIPDFRNTLYWNPAVKSSGKNKASVEFWTSDGVGSYEVTLQGVNLNGEPVSSRKVLTVK